MTGGRIKRIQKYVKKEKHFLNGETELLGINLFKIESMSSDSWQDIPEYLGMKFLIYENLLS